MHKKMGLHKIKYALQQYDFQVIFLGFFFVEFSFLLLNFQTSSKNGGSKRSGEY